MLQSETLCRLQTVHKKTAKNCKKNCRGSLDEQWAGQERGVCGLYLRVNQARTCYTAQCTPLTTTTSGLLLCAQVSIRYICVVCSQRVQRARKEAEKGARRRAEAEAKSREREQKMEGGGGG